MAGAVFQPCWSAWGIPALETTGCWVVPRVGKKMATFKRPMRAPQNCCYQRLCLCSESQPPLCLSETLHYFQAIWPSLFEVTAFSPESWCVKPCVCHPRVEFVSPSPADLLFSNPTCLQSHILWGLLLSPDLQVGEPDMGLRTFPPVGDPLWYNYFPVCRSPTWHVGDLILSWLCSLLASHCGFFLSLDVGYLRLMEASLSGV